MHINTPFIHLYLQVNNKSGDRTLLLDQRSATVDEV